jgi:hypothetical protein
VGRRFSDVPLDSWGLVVCFVLALL